MLPLLIEQGSGAVVNISSVAGLQGVPGIGPYVASKHAVIAILTGLVPMARYGSPDEVGEVIGFLVSPAAAYVNGAVWSVDGGQLAS